MAFTPSMIAFSAKEMREISLRIPVVGRQQALDEAVAAKRAALGAAEATEKERRKIEDAERIEAVDRWPMSHLPLKTQPWITNAEGRMRFALIHCTDLLTVIEEGKAPATFKSVAEIVETWSVD